MRHRGFCTWGILTGQFGAGWAHFVLIFFIFFNLFDFHAGESNYVIPAVPSREAAPVPWKVCESVQCINRTITYRGRRVLVPTLWALRFVKPRSRSVQMAFIAVHSTYGLSRPLSPPEERNINLTSGLSRRQSPVGYCWRSTSFLPPSHEVRQKRGKWNSRNQAHVKIGHKMTFVLGNLDIYL